MATDTDQGANDTQRHIFPFFKLARELRNEIYDLSLGNYDGKLKSPFGMAVTATQIPVTNLLLVSRGFKKEYLDRASKRSHMAITDKEGWILETSQSRNICLPPAAAGVSTVKVNLMAFQEVEIKAHQEWLSSRLAELRSLSSLSVRVNFLAVTGSQREADEMRSELNGSWTQWQALTAMKAYQKYDFNKLWDFESEGDLRFEWSSVTGEVEDVSKRSGLSDKTA